jgi:NADPH:quinone reductase-like Zn-dependent oxidoreductase
MHAMVLDPAGESRYVPAELALPEPGPGQLRLKLRAASVNYRDHFIRLHPQSSYGGDMRGRVPLSDGVGVIDELGEGVSGWAVGDRVCPGFFPGWCDGAPTPDGLAHALGAAAAGGTAQQYLVVPAAACVAAPAHMSDAEAATLTCAGLTAWVSLVEYGRLRAGQTVLVQGTGGVSLFALQIAKAMGARVILLSSSDEKLERARKLGADELINYRAVPDWQVPARDMTGGGVDHIVEVGGEATMARSFEALGPGGSIGLIGVLTGFGGAIPYDQVKEKLLHVHGVYVGSVAEFARMNAFLAEHRIRPVVDAVSPLDELDEVVTQLGEGRHFGKLAVEIDAA